MAIELEPGNPWGWAFLGHLYHEKLQRYADAEAAYRKAIELKEDADWPWYQLGRLLHSHLGRYEEAEKIYRRAIALRPDEPWGWAHLGQLLHEKLDRYEDAEAAYRKAIELKPAEAWSWRQLGQLLHLKLGHFDDAEIAYRKAIEIQQEDSWIWTLLGQLLHEKLNRYEEAEVAYRKAIELNQEDALPWAWARLGQLLHEKLNRLQEAEVAYRQSIASNPDNLWGWALLSKLLAVDMRSPEKVLELTSCDLFNKSRLVTDPCIWNTFAWHLLKSGCVAVYAQAELWARKALEMDPTNGHILHTLATILTQQGKCDEAIVYSKQLLEEVESVKKIVDDIVQLFTDLAACGHAEAILNLLKSSPCAPIFEPLVVALRLFLGEDVKVAIEVREVASDVLDLIRQKQNISAQ